MKGNNAILKQYSFGYDNANRLLTATYADAGKYTTHYTYDKNGNIETLTRMGELGGSNTYGYIDQLTYAYTGNQLKYVNDNTGDNHQNNGFTDNGSLLTTNEYFYDLNGNLTRDLNKQINHIEYNYLNLPRRIDLSGANLNTINYLYSANGVKLQKNTSISHARSAPTDYLGTMVYPGDAPAYIFTPEGRALRNENGGFDYEYFLTDHLGNTRVSFNQKGTILQDNSYYPFGISLGESLTYMDNTTNENKYLYNGKEMQDDFGLGWYDYGARFYDPQLGMWHVPDMLAEQYVNSSPYNYTLNNPIKYIDPNGMYVDGYTVDEDGYVEKVDNTGGDDYDVLYTKKDYEAAKESGETNEYGNPEPDKQQKVSDTELLPQLEESKPDGIQKDWLTGEKIQGHYTKFSKAGEGVAVFKFLAENSNVEWTFQGNTGNNNIIGTLHENAQAFSVSGFEGFNRETIKFHIHSHPGTTKDDFKPSDKDRINADRTWKVNPKAKYYIYMPKLTKSAYNKAYPNNPINYEPSTIYPITK